MSTTRLFFVFLMICWPVCPVSAAAGVVVITVDGAIGPATAAYVAQGIEQAELEQAPALVLRMDTPGGLDTSMRSIVKAIGESRVPVIGYVAPTGARAASAGTYILYACQVAAMAPGTNLGAATPIALGELPGPEATPHGGSDDEADRDSDKGEDATPVPGDAKTRKLVNDAAAYIRGLAELHGRNADWGERAVREGESLSAEEALALGVIDIISPDIGSLLSAVDGRRVRLGSGFVTLDTASARIDERGPDWKTRLLAVISDPNVAYILMLIGIYGLIYELSNPGTVLPGTLGAVSLLLALYAFALLPVSYAGAALILLGFALMISEAFTPAFGTLGLGGAASFVIGSMILIDTEAPGFGISVPLILGFGVASALFLALVVGIAIKAWRHPPAAGAEELIGAHGEAVSGFPGEGRVHVHGEVWRARSDSPIARGDRVEVVDRDGLTLLVRPSSLGNL